MRFLVPGRIMKKIPTLCLMVFFVFSLLVRHKPTLLISRALKLQEELRRERPPGIPDSGYLLGYL
jgi:hypothetical protein